MALTFTVGGIDHTDDVYRIGSRGTLTFDYVLQSDWKASFPLYDLDSTSSAYRPSLGDEVSIADGGTVIFHGRIDEINDQPIAGSGTGTLSMVSCKSLAAILDQIEVDEDYRGVLDLSIANSSAANPTSITTNQPHGLTTGDLIRIEGHEGSSPSLDGDHTVTVTSASTFTIPVNNASAGGGGTVRRIYTREALVTDLFTTYLDPEGLTLDAAMSTGPNIEAPFFQHITVKGAFDYLAQITGEMWRVDPDGDEVQFFAAGEKTAISGGLTAANRRTLGPIRWVQDLYSYANDIRLTYGTSSVVRKTDTFTGDGANNFWTLKYTAKLDTNQWVISAGYVEESSARYPIAPLTDILTSSVANPTVIRTRYPHGLESGVSVVIQGHSGSTPSLNSTHTATVVDAYTFTVPVNVTVAGTGGSCYNPGYTYLFYATSNTVFRVGALAAEATSSFAYDVQFPQTVTAEDAGEITARGRFRKAYTEPTLFDVDAAQELADGLLAYTLELPRKVSVSTRFAMPLPGDQVVLTFADRLVSGNHLVTSVHAEDAQLDGTMQYDLVCVSGDTPADTRLDRFRRVTSGGGGSTGTAGGRVVSAVSGSSRGNVLANPGTDQEVEIGAVSAGTVPNGNVVGLRFGRTTKWVMGVRPKQSPGTGSGYEWVLFDSKLSSAEPVLRLIDDTVNVILALNSTFTSTVRGVALGENATGKRFAEVNALIQRAQTAYYERGRSTPVGEWSAIAHADANYTGDVTGNADWVVDSADQVQLSETRIGTTVILNYSIQNTDVANSPSQLRITVPTALVGGGRYTNKCSRALDAGASVEARAVIDAAVSTTTVLILKTDGTAWTNTTSDDTLVEGQLIYQSAA